MNNKSDLATYKGKGWKERKTIGLEEFNKGIHWHSAGVNSEWNVLREVALYIPNANQQAPSSPNDFLHVAQVSYDQLSKEVQALSDLYRSEGIKVHLVGDSPFGESILDYGSEHLHNLVFVPDLCINTPFGMIMARMGAEIRAGEEKYIARCIGNIGIPTLYSIGGMGTFEGSDAMWLSPDSVIIGVGNRTNREGANQLVKVLNIHGVTCQTVELPPTTQHLMGILRIVDERRALVRNQIAPQKLIQILRELDFEIISIDESSCVSDHFAMNCVVLSKNRIVSPLSECSLNEFLSNKGIDVQCVEASNMIKAGGGVGCVTGIFRRDLIPFSNRKQDEQ